MDEQHSNLDELQAAYKAAVEEWISAIRKEEALASVNHSVAEVDLWENAGFEEDEKRKVVKELKTKYEDALREKFFGFLEPFPFRLDRKALFPYFDAFSSREPVSTPDQVRGGLSLENALTTETASTSDRPNRQGDPEKSNVCA